MSQSLRSIFVVFFSLFTAISGTWLYLNSKAKNKPIKTPFEHSFTTTAHEGGRRLVLLRVQTPADAALAVRKNNTITSGLWLDVHLGGENQLVVARTDLLPGGAMKGKPIEISSRAECESAGLFELSEFYPHLKAVPVVLNLISRRPGLSNKILEIWGDGSKPLSLDNVALQAESDGTLKELREGQPRGLFGSSQSALIQIEVLANFGLEELVNLKSDLVISDQEERRSGAMVVRKRAATLGEAHRRGLRRYAGPARSLESAKELFEANYDGVLVEGRDVFDALLNQEKI